jgi:hypothetical protein
MTNVDANIAMRIWAAQNQSTTGVTYDAAFQNSLLAGCVVFVFVLLIATLASIANNKKF